MKDISVDLMQYALVGASLFILVAVGFLAIWWNGLAKRDAKKELKNKKKAEKKQQKLEAKQQAKAQKGTQQPNPQVEAVAQAEEIARAEAAAQAEEIARAEAAAQAEEIARAEAVAQAEEIARAEAVARAEEMARAEAVARAEEIARAEAVARAEEIARAEAVAQAEEIARAEAAAQAEAEAVAKAKMAARLEEIEKAKARVEVTPRREYDDLVAGATVAAVTAGVQIPRFETSNVDSERIFTIKFYKMQTNQLFENYSFRLEDSLTIGRNPGYHHWTIIDDLTVSGNHCKIYQKDGQIYILDLNSTNGTYVNDQRVRGQMRLENHDKISIGQGSYRIRIE